MNGLEFEFKRFADICFEGADEEEIAVIKKMFMAGALAQANRMLCILDSDLPLIRKLALARRIARECEGFQQKIVNEVMEVPSEQ